MLDQNAATKYLVCRFHEIFAADLPTPVTDVMARAQRPLEAGVLQEPTHNPAWKTIPSWFLLPTEDRVIGTDAERAMAVRAGSQIVEVRASHEVLVLRPTKVTKLIEEAARATATSWPRTLCRGHRRETHRGLWDDAMLASGSGGDRCVPSARED